MFRSVVICPDHNISARLTEVLEKVGHGECLRVLDRYPAVDDLQRVLRAQAAEILFLSFESAEKARDIVEALQAEGSPVNVVAVHRSASPAVLLETMRMGVREFLTDPFEPQAVTDSLSHVRQVLLSRPVQYKATDQIFTFLPSKAGVGASTLALNISAAMARRSGTSVLLSDFDLNSGMMRFMLKLGNTHSVIEAIEHGDHMDEGLWPQLVTPVSGLDILHSGPVNPNIRIESGQVRGLVDFARRSYDALCFDLSGNLERYSLELMFESKRVLLVCTPELASLHLAREKLAFMRKLDLHSRVSIILNRVPKKALLGKDQVEELVGVPVIQEFPNDYASVNRAVEAGRVVSPSTELGRSFEVFAAQLLNQAAPAPAASKRKFLEFFSIPSREPLSAE